MAKKQKCYNGNIHKGRKHPCPFQEDVGNNPEPHCNCCVECQNDCCDEI